MDWYWDSGVGGHSSWGEGGVSNFNIGDNGSSFFILLTPGALRSWFLQMSPVFPNSVFLINSLFNWTNFSFLSISHLNSFALTKSFFTCLWFASSSWVNSWRSNNVVSCWTMWTKELSSRLFGKVKKYCQELISPWPNCGPMGFCWVIFFCGHMFIEGAEWRIWTIIDIAIDRVRDVRCEVSDLLFQC